MTSTREKLNQALDKRVKALYSHVWNEQRLAIEDEKFFRSMDGIHFEASKESTYIGGYLSKPDYKRENQKIHYIRKNSRDSKSWLGGLSGGGYKKRYFVLSIYDGPGILRYYSDQQHARNDINGCESQEKGGKGSISFADIDYIDYSQVRDAGEFSIDLVSTRKNIHYTFNAESETDLLNWALVFIRCIRVNTTSDGDEAALLLFSGTGGLVCENLREWVSHKVVRAIEDQHDLKSFKMNAIKSVIESGSEAIVNEKTKKEGKTALHIAIQKLSVFSIPDASLQLQGLSLVKYLCEHAAIVEATDMSLNTPLHYATNSLAVTKYLIEAMHANIEAKNSLGETPLIIAAAKKDLPVLNYLLKKGANRNVQVKVRDEVYTLIDYAFREQIKNQTEDFSMFQCLFDNGINVDTITHTDKTLLHSLTGEYHVNFAIWLCQHGADIENKNIEGCTPVQTYVQKNDIKMVKCLCKLDADIEKNMHGVDLHDNELITEWERANENVMSLSMLNWAVLNHKKKKTNDILIKNEAGDWITQQIIDIPNYMELINILCIDGNADLEKFMVTDSCGMRFTPLHWAVYHQHFDIVEYLCKQGANMEALDYENKTPIFHAVTHTYDSSDSNTLPNEYLNIAKYLLKQGVNYDAIDNDGMSPIFYAVGLSMVIEHLAMVKLLVAYKVDLHKIDNEGSTLLHLAASGAGLPTVQYLYEHGCGCSSNSSDGHIHSSGINDVKNTGESPLHLAILNDHIVHNDKLSVVKFLCDHGANPLLASWYSKSPLDLAKEFMNGDLDEGEDPNDHLAKWHCMIVLLKSFGTKNSGAGDGVSSKKINLIMNGDVDDDGDDLPEHTDNDTYGSQQACCTMM